jgi:hypothetical protein
VPDLMRVQGLHYVRISRWPRHKSS